MAGPAAERATSETAESATERMEDGHVNLRAACAMEMSFPRKREPPSTGHAHFGLPPRPRSGESNTYCPSVPVLVEAYARFRATRYLKIKLDVLSGAALR